MARPIKCRRVNFIPGVTYFKPAGVPLRFLEEVVITVEEAESLRLKELERLEQEQGAEKMNISRPTFQRILASARYKIADALLNGKAMRIEGGTFILHPLRFRCERGHEWEAPHESAETVPQPPCPTCDTENVELLQPGEALLNRKGYGRRLRRGNFTSGDGQDMKQFKGGKS